MFIYHLFSSIILVFDMKNIFLYHMFPQFITCIALFSYNMYNIYSELLISYSILLNTLSILFKA